MKCFLCENEGADVPYLDKEGDKHLVCTLCRNEFYSVNYPFEATTKSEWVVPVGRHIRVHENLQWLLLKPCHSCGEETMFHEDDSNIYTWIDGMKVPYCYTCRSGTNSCIFCGSRHNSLRCPDCGTYFDAFSDGAPYTKGTGRTIGIEIECNTPLKAQHGVKEWGHADIKRDHSLRGDEAVEYTSVHPLYESNYKDWVKDITQLIRPSVVYNRCGLHLHIGDNWSWWEVYNILRYCRYYQRTFFRLVSPSRRGHSGNNAGLPYSIPSVPDMSKRKEFIKWLYGTENIRTRVHHRAGDQGSQVHSEAHIHRYWWLNVNSYFYQGTLEVRLHQGTTNRQKITMWTDFWLSILPKISTGQYSGCPPLSLTHGHIKKYYIERIKTLDNIYAEEI